MRALGKQKEMRLKREWEPEDREASPALAKSLAFTPTEIFAQNNLTSLGWERVEVGKAQKQGDLFEGYLDLSEGYSVRRKTPEKVGTNSNSGVTDDLWQNIFTWFGEWSVTKFLRFLDAVGKSTEWLKEIFIIKGLWEFARRERIGVWGQKRHSPS